MEEMSERASQSTLNIILCSALWRIRAQGGFGVGDFFPHIFPLPGFLPVLLGVGGERRRGIASVAPRCRPADGGKGVARAWERQSSGTRGSTRAQLRRGDRGQGTGETGAAAPAARGGEGAAKTKAPLSTVVSDRSGVTTD